MNYMKCKKCGEKAVIKMRQHKLALCKPHFLEWIPEQTERFIKKYAMFSRHEKILVAVSGGKDSLSLWDVLWRLGYSVDGVYIHLGVDGGVNYSAVSEKYAAEFAHSRALGLQVINVPQIYGATVPELAESTSRGQGRACSVCGLVKRHIMNQVAYDGNYQVLVTGHNLDDEAAALFGNTITWSTEMLQRQGVVLKEAPGFARKTKPFCRFYERETAAYALLSGIPYIYDECPFSIGSKSLYYKDVLNRLEEENPGIKLNFYLGFLRARECGFIPQKDVSPERYAQRCPICNQPTTTDGLCSFCRLVARE